KAALIWPVVSFSLAMLFGLALAPVTVPGCDRQHTIEFLTGYIIELSLSMDNVFVIALLFAYFRVPQQFQHRVLFWGILGALVMRGVMIWLGVELIHRFTWMFYVLGVFLIFTGIKMVFFGHDEVHPDKNLVISLTRRLFA